MAWRYANKLGYNSKLNKKLKDLEEILLKQINSYTKKLLMFENTVEKLNKALGGIKIC